MNLAGICYGIQQEDRQDGKRYRRYLLEKNRENVGELVCGPVIRGMPVPFELRLGDEYLRWECFVSQEWRHGKDCYLKCPQIDWVLNLIIPYRKSAELIRLGPDGSGFDLIKRETRLSWGQGSLWLRDDHSVEHFWSIALDTSMMAFAMVIVRIFTLGLLPYRNEEWVLGSSAANSLSGVDQQKLCILNATIRMLLLPNDFHHD
jgi:hypothetical protein